MKIDTYTKIVLTIIAICLCINTFNSSTFVPKAYATPADVPIAPNAVMDVRIVDVSTYDALNVTVKDINTSDALNVNLKKIETSDELDVNIDEIGGAWLSHGDAIKVRME